MALFKCKMCGGALEINNHESVAVCEYCGTQQTIPRLDDDKRANLYDRASHFRRNNEFDKAMGLYEQILNEDGTDAEAYWSLVLCRYGIEYVEDPASHKRVPTVNRAQFTSVFDDDNYKSALQYADGSQKSIYEEEAKTINEIQKGILTISQQEEPFDVFICYKETDNSGRRTPDSVLANELYHELTEEGFKVFFSRITLEDKIGSAYEPYIFAALNSAKVMVVLGTRPEYFQAPWVKNEWSRYLALIRNGAKKTLIPAYKDMDPYDLPEEFSHLQAQDMSKLGFMQDIIRGIGKIAEVDEPKKAVGSETAAVGMGVNKESLFKRVLIFLEDGDWKSADEYSERILDMDPEMAEAYLGKLMAELHIKKQEELANCGKPFSNSNNYQKAIRYGDEALKNTLQGYIEQIKERNENARLESIYSEAVAKMEEADSEESYKDAAARFFPITEYKDSSARREKCLNEAEICRKDAIYHMAKDLMSDNIYLKKSGYTSAILKFQEISGWKDADEQVEICERKLEEIEQEEERNRIEEEKQARQKIRRKRMTLIIIAAIICAIVAIVVFIDKVIVPEREYQDAVALIDEEKYEEAYERLLAMEGYKDSSEKAEELKTVTIPEKKYQDAIALIDEEKYEEAYEKLLALNGYRDSSEKAEELKTVTIPEKKYQDAIAWIGEEKYVEAYEQLRALEGYKDSKEQANAIRFEYETVKGKQVKVGDYIIFGAYEQDNDKSNGKEAIEWIVLAKEGNKSLVISRYALDNRAYHKKIEDVTWKTCSLRKWLNKGFMNKAFSQKEKAMIPTVKVETEIVNVEILNPYLPSSEFEISKVPGKSTKDRVFLLRSAEVEEFFSSNKERKCKVYPALGTDGCRWLLQSCGGAVTSVDALGLIEEFNFDVTTKCAIRPAMWIDWSTGK